MESTSRTQASAAESGIAAISRLIERAEFSQALAEIERLEQSENTPPPLAAELSYLRAAALFGLARYRESLEAARAAFTFYNESVDHRRLGDVLSIMGKAYAGKGDLKSARIQIRNALAAFFRSEYVDGIIRSYNELARIEFIRGEFDLAIDHLTEAISHCEQTGNAEFKAKLTGNLGRIHLLRGHWEPAKASLESAMKTQQHQGNALSVTRNRLSLGLLACRQGNFTQAHKTLSRALTCIEENDYPRERAIAEEYFGMLSHLQGDFDQAVAHFERALAIGKTIAERGDLVSQSLRGMAEAYFESGETTAAEKTAREALDIALALGEKTEVGAVYRILGRFYAERNNAPKARKHFEKSLTLLREVGDTFELAWTAYYYAHFLIDNGDPALRLQARSALAECETKFGALGGRFWADTPLVLRVALEIADDNLAVAGQLLTRLNTRADNDQWPVWLFAEPLRKLRASWEHRLAQHAVGDKNEFRIFNSALSEGEAEGLRGGDFDDSLKLLIHRLSVDGAAVILPHPETEDAECMVAFNLTERQKRRVVRLISGGPFDGFPLDKPRLISHLPDRPNVFTFLNRDMEDVTQSILTVPLNLGPDGAAILYLERRRNGSRPPAFLPADVDFAVAFAEVLGLKYAARRQSGLLADNLRLKQQLNEKAGFPSIITANQAMIEMLERVRLVIDSNISVLVQGETGTGKDLLAKAIHYNSNRREQPFISVNCAALPDSLLESELFGYKKGAFTGAIQDKNGLFEAADGGTFFLDEIGEMPLALQAKILRLLEEKEIVRLGETKPRKVDVRIISATNRELKQTAEQGAFRQDLYYRLSALSFTLPPLRERSEDIPLLADHFLKKCTPDSEAPPRLSAEALRQFIEYSWPGNVRELENEIRKLLLLRGSAEEIGPELLSHKFTQEEATAEPAETEPDLDDFSLYDHLAGIEKKYILRALAKSDWVKKHAAQQLGIPESTLRLKMRQYHLERPKA